MEDFFDESEHPKKRRRRMGGRKPLSARLVFDENLRGHSAVLSPDLWAELVSSRTSGDDEDNPTIPTKSYVALAPWSPLHSLSNEVPWTISAATQRSASQSEHVAVPHSTVFVAQDSSSLQSLLRVFEGLDHARQSSHIPKSIDIRVAQVDPIFLDTVYVTVEKGLLERVDEIQTKFGGGFQSSKFGRVDKRAVVAQKASATGEEDRLPAMVRQGLAQLNIVHCGDVFPLPLPAHPITHVRPPPAIAIYCEPVTQGMMSPSTRIILIQAGSAQEAALKQLQPTQPIIEESIEDTAEDTSNDQFFSAAEDRTDGTSSELDGADPEGDSDSEDSQDHSDDGSDDSMDDMISMSAPGLPPAQSGTLSAMTAATPRPGGRKSSGIHTPGSVYSSFTSATARAGSRPGKIFRTEALLRKIPPEALHPRPGSEDDEEAFVFVDTSTLAKIGCFSGDWVRIEIAKNTNPQGFSSLGLGALNGYNDEESDWRVVKIFGISSLPNQRPRYAVDKTGERRSSFTGGLSFSLTPSIYLPPTLLTNIASAPFVKVGVLPKPQRVESVRALPSQAKSSNSQNPPLAKEVTLLKVSTPLATSKDLQPILFSGLKRHFEVKNRILKKGDLLAIVIDEALGKTTFSAGSSADSSGIDDLLAAQLSTVSQPGKERSAVTWFKVDHISTEPIQHLDDIDERDSWGGVAIIDASNTRISQARSCSQAISQTTTRNTEYWLGSKRVPKQLSVIGSAVMTTSDLPATEPLPLENRLRDLITAATSLRAINLGLPPLAILLYSTQRQIGKAYTATAACSAAGVQAFPISAHDMLSENASTTGGGDVKTEILLKSRSERALACGPQFTSVLLQHIEVLTGDRMVPALQEIISNSRVFLATTTELDKIPPAMRSIFTHELELTAPNEIAREVILRNASLSLPNPVSPSVAFKSLALQTAALVAGDLVDLISRAALARSRRLVSLAQTHKVDVSDLALAGGESTTHITQVDFNAAIAAARVTFSDSIGAPKIPSVTWSDVGGLASQKDAIMETISLPLTRPELFANGIRKRSGILFYGPPGTGKTLLAKAIATEFSLNFFSVKGPELLNMYIGESEANVRRVFQRARDARPCVVFFDELDSVAPKRGNQGDSGGVMDRIVSQLLAELDGMSSGGSGDDNDNNGGSSPGGVFVIGATNRPDLLDPALLRPGRFDKMLYLGVAANHEQQATIMQALTRKFKLATDVDLKRIAERLPFTYTGADLYALCSDAMLKAITRKTKLVDRRVEQISRAKGESITTGYFFDHLAKPEDIEVVVSDADFMAAQAELVGSVSAKELEHFERIRSQFEEQDISNVEGGKEKDKAQASATLPLRPGMWSNQTHATGPAPTLGAQRPPSSQGRLESQGPPQLMTMAKIKEREREREKIKAKERAGTFTAGKMKARPIANPDSGNESDGEDDGDEAYGTVAGNGHMNGNVDVNGVKGRGKGKGKGKDTGGEKEVMDGFVDDVEGDDEGLYS